MESFHWDAHFETGLAEGDRQHHILVNLINRFGDLLTRVDPVSLDTLEEVQGELTAYSQYHFKEEEDLMRRAAIDARHFARHEQVHHGFLQEVTRLGQTVLQHNAAPNPCSSSWSTGLPAIFSVPTNSWHGNCAPSREECRRKTPTSKKGPSTRES